MKKTAGRLIGFMLSGDDNDSYMLGADTRPSTEEECVFHDRRFTLNGGPHPALCTKCGRKVDPDYVSPTFKLAKKGVDIGVTYDGYTIVSERFRDFIATAALSGVELVDLPSQPRHFWFRVNRILEIDRKRSDGLRLLYYCDRCEHYAGVFGTSALRYVGVDTEIPPGVFRTDLEFAQSHEQSPVVIMDKELAQKMSEMKFTGIQLKKILLHADGPMVTR
jgi:hypothetical protein